VKREAAYAYLEIKKQSDNQISWHDAKVGQDKLHKFKLVEIMPKFKMWGSKYGQALSWTTKAHVLTRSTHSHIWSIVGLKPHISPPSWGFYNPPRAHPVTKDRLGAIKYQE